ncbi:CaiB/BaiF CoA transferase family protein [Nocardia cerradoensis]|uniref:Succinyl-CoA--L-malate CoA-transferase beta subunit n=1 Tax=Nocardia cerradoensis TaxID=85688 RepID=A0A231H6Y3_9NOCA|nr:CaiB/BaiF CoA-transferase family protein [Nocardia cerradoensis]NKY47483.1 CoA transferase [Nocardia cerradoensis]OXR44507.1 Succinyl-CoA--L-malate CoA-transferase beta subunit [Nocardia cerradoensis]
MRTDPPTTAHPEAHDSETEAVPGAAGPLDGFRVLELGTLIAGPYCGRLLGDMGADVIKIEAPDRPDPLRDWGQAAGGGHQYFWTVHARNKRCVSLDLRVPAGRDIFLELARTADVVVESFRPGTLERWGIGYDVLSELNPGLVLARVSGYGQTGPYASRAGYASVAEGISGLRHLNGFPGQAPPRMALSLGDSLAGLFAFQGVLAALLVRERTGRGQVVDAALTEASLAIQESTVPDFHKTGHVRQPSGTRLDRVAPSNLYKAEDGLWVIIAANQDTVFGRLVTAMGRPELASDPRYSTHSARGERQDELDEMIAAWAGDFTAADLIDLLNRHGVVAGPVNTVAEVMADPQFTAREIFVDHVDPSVGRDDAGYDPVPVKGVGVVPRLSATAGGVRWGGPSRPGTHTDEVLGELLGYDADRLAGLRGEGTIG